MMKLSWITNKNPTNQIFTARKRSYGKVMFSQACVKNSVHRGRCKPPWADTPLGRHPVPPRQTPLLGRHPPPHHQTATAADGTHPTGMHSCFCCRPQSQFNNQILCDRKYLLNVMKNILRKLTRPLSLQNLLTEDNTPY